MKMNIQKLKQDLNNVAAKIVEVKAILREPHQPRKTWRTQPELESLKYEATRLCSIRASHRGKIHMKGKTLEEQAEFVGDTSEYMLEEEAAA
jgi:DNA gyrase/topoisomerase IV subunit A